MLYESDVIQAICAYLVSRDYQILQELKPTQRGDDIIAVKDKPHIRKFFIEAKGETSSRRDSARFGKPFDGAQVRDHVSAAFYKAAEILSRKQVDVEIRAGIALPITEKHQRMIENIQPVLHQLGIMVFWVEESGDVRVESNWEINY